MNLSDAIYHLETHKRNLGITTQVAVELVIQVLMENVDVEAWDEEDRLNTPMCQHCSGNGCASCNQSGEA